MSSITSEDVETLKNVIAHYTTVENAIKILQLGELKFSERGRSTILLRIDIT